MMDKQGGMAFPAAFRDVNGEPVYGMILRDYFAAKAMQCYCGNEGLSDELIARYAYTTADAMLAERNRIHD